MNETDIKIEDTIKNFDFEESRKNTDEKIRKVFKYLDIKHIECHDSVDTCCHELCDKLQTEYMEVQFFGIKYFIPLCRRHAEQFEQLRLREIGFGDNVDKEGFPIVFCKDNGIHYYFYCRYCQTIHKHGREEGHRRSHCLEDSSSYIERGYILKLVSGEYHCYGLDEDGKWKFSTMEEYDLDYLGLLDSRI